MNCTEAITSIKTSVQQYDAVAVLETEMLHHYRRYTEQDSTEFGFKSELLLHLKSADRNLMIQ